MSELNKQLWAVLSERGCVARDLAYEEAAELVRQLASHNAHGLYVVTNEAVQRLPASAQCPSNSSSQPTEIQEAT